MLNTHRNTILHIRNLLVPESITEIIIKCCSIISDNSLILCQVYVATEHRSTIVLTDKIILLLERNVNCCTMQFQCTIHGNNVFSGSVCHHKTTESVHQQLYCYTRHYHNSGITPTAHDNINTTVMKILTSVTCRG